MLSRLQAEEVYTALVKENCSSLRFDSMCNGSYVKVPGGLAFSEFRGYEAWQAISISRNERVVAMILGNP